MTTTAYGPFVRIDREITDRHIIYRLIRNTPKGAQVLIEYKRKLSLFSNRRDRDRWSNRIAHNLERWKDYHEKIVPPRYRFPGYRTRA